MDVYVERLYAALTDALRRSRQHPFGSPVTVAEIYQDLVPYRVVRSAIGFEMNADYEHALLQMLAGVGGLAQLEPESAAAELRDELATPNPNVGLFRKFAACDVWITPAADEANPENAGEVADRRAGWAAGEPEESDDAGFAPEPVEAESARAEPDLGALGGDIDRSRPADPVARASLPGDPHALHRPRATSMSHGATPSGSEREPEQPPRATDAAYGEEHALTERMGDADASAAAPAASVLRDTSRRCGFCDAKLPAGRLVRFCPHCGGDQTRRPCVACGEALEPGWRYCVTCGAPQEGSGTA